MEMTAKNNFQYPYNLLNKLYGKEMDMVFPNGINADQMEGLNYILSLLEKEEKQYILLRYKQGLKFLEIADIFHVTAGNIEQRIFKICNLKLRPRRYYIEKGLRGFKQEMHCLKETNKEAIPIEYLDLPQKYYNALKRAHLHTVGDILDKMKTSSAKWYASAYNVGKQRAIFVETVLIKEGLIKEEMLYVHNKTCKKKA